MSLRRQVLSSIRWTTASSLGRAMLQIVQVAILARLLTPEDFGLMAIVLALMAFLQIFADAGVSNAIIHYQDISREQLSSLYWLNVSVAILLAVLLMGTSLWLVSWYQQPLLQPLFSIATASMVAGALWQQLSIHAQKTLRFSQLAKIELMSAFAGFAVTISLAWIGVGVFAIAFGGLAGAVVACSLAWLVLAEGWRPLWRLNLKEIKPFLKYGGYMIGNNLANTFNGQVDVLVGSSMLGAQATGLYSVPKELSLRIAGIFNPVITQVGLPVMAKSQTDFGLMRRVYLQTLRMTASVNFPLYIVLAIFAPEVGRLLLGDKWEVSLFLLQIFACWGLIRSTASPVGSLLMAAGRADLAFKWNMGMLMVVLPALYFASGFGIEGIAISMFLLMAGAFLPNWYFLVHPLCGARLFEYSIQLLVPLFISVVSVGVGYLVVYCFDSDIVRLTLGAIASACIYCAMSLRYNRVYTDAMQDLLKMRRR